MVTFGDGRSSGVKNLSEFRKLVQILDIKPESVLAAVYGLPEGSLSHKKAAMKAAIPWLQDADYRVCFESFYGDGRLQPDVAVSRIDGQTFKTPQGREVSKLYMEVGTFASDRIENNFRAIEKEKAVIALVTKKGRIIQELSPL